MKGQFRTMKFYSEKTKTFFDSVKDCEKAEKEFDEKQAVKLKEKEERAKMAKEVDEAYKHADDLLKQFCEKYGAYHKTTYKPATVSELFDFLNHLPFPF